MKPIPTTPSHYSRFSVRGSTCTFAFPTPRSAPGSPLSFPLSVFCFLLFLGSASAATRYVWQGSPGPAPPYTNWASAANVIQDAVDAAQTDDTVLVAGGVYTTGGRAAGTNLLVNRVAIDRAITVQSLMGPEVTSIVGAGPSGSNAVRCVYLTNAALLAGFTLTNGATQTSGDYYADQSGGGVWCESLTAVVSNCVLTANSASSSGGGAYSGTPNNCALTGNSADWPEYGGGGARSGERNRKSSLQWGGSSGMVAQSGEDSPLLFPQFPSVRE